ncbi:unnamed protein product, partial [Hydatigera taeniaeformis]|uniref:WD_REPEATS_REGION domain-containing protein n=1 Tax=Hydatigena taeniaeformis TaxID=6205 RepID=A0A0R3X7W6_HYDTA
MSNVTADAATAAVVSTTTTSSSSSSSGSDSSNSIGSKNNNIGTVSSDGVDWFQKFKWRYQVRKNWARGKHRIRRFVGHTGGKWRHHSLLPISILIRCCALVIDLLIKASVHCLAYDAYRIVSGSADSTICVWKVCSNANWLAQTLRGHSGAVRCLELLPLPPALASSTSPTVTTPSPSVWEPPEALLISGSVDTSLKLWRLSSTFEWSRITCIGTLQGHFDTVRCVQADSKKAVSGSYDCTIRLWDLASSRQKVIFRGHTGGVVCLTYDDSLLYSGSLDNTVRIWSLNTSVCYYTLVRPGTRPGAEFWTTPVTSLHLDIQRRRLFVAHHDGRICVWHIPSSPPSLQSGIKDESSKATSLARPELVEQLYVEAANSQATGAVIRCLAGDGWHLLCGCDDQTIKVWRADTNTPVGCLRGHEDGVTCLLIYGSVVISGSYDKNVILYDFDPKCSGVETLVQPHVGRREVPAVSTECLMRASQVNRAWNRATHHPRLFQRLCCSPEWSLPNLDAHFPPPLECRNANFFFPNLPSPSDTTTMSN